MTNSTFDANLIDHTNEELMRHYFSSFAAERGITRRDAEIRFRTKWASMKRKLTSDRNHTYQVLRDHIEA